MRIIKKTQGAISIFLAIIFTVSIYLTGVLVDGSRVRAGETEVKSALDTSVMSLLTDYNNILKEQYGLFALSENDPEALKEAVIDNMNKILMTELGVDKEDKYESIYNGVKNYIVGKDDQPSLDLFGYNVENVNVQPMYNLSENEVVRSQIVEYMKYRAPKALGEEFLDKILAFKDFAKQSKIMKDKTKFDKALNEIQEDQADFSEKVGEINTGFNNGNIFAQEMEYYAKGIAQKIYYEKDAEIKSLQRDELAKKIATMAPDPTPAPDAKTTSGSKQQAMKDLKDIEDNISRTLTEAGKGRSGAIQAAQVMRDHAKEYMGKIDNAITVITNLETKSDEANTLADSVNNNIKEDSSDFAESIRVDVGGKKKNIDRNVLEKEKKALQDNKAILQNLYNITDNMSKGATIDAIKTSDITPIIQSAKDTVPTEPVILTQVQTKLSGTFAQIKSELSKITWIDFYVPKVEEGEEEDDPRDSVDDYIDKVKEDEEKQKDEMKKKESKEKFPADTLPSSGNKDAKKDSNTLYKSIIEGDTAEVKQLTKDMIQFNQNQNKDDPAYKDPYEGNEELKDDVLGNTDFSDKDSDFSENSFNVLSILGDSLSNGLRNMRDELYVNEYIMGTFLNTLSEKNQEKDLRQNIKVEDVDSGKRKTYFNNNCEIEYILGGTGSETDNLWRVRAQILLIRFALNTISIYTQPDKFDIAMEVALSVAGWTGFGVPIVHTLIMLGWSMAESVLDVTFIMQGSDKIPIFKTRNTWILGLGQGAADTLQGILTDLAKGVASTVAKEVIDYGAQSATELVDNTLKEVNESINSRIDIAVDKAFQPIETQIYGMFNKVDNGLNSFQDSLEAKSGEIVDESFNEIENFIYNNTNSYLDEAQKKDEGKYFGVIETLKGDIKAKEEQFKQEIKGKTNNQIKEIRKKYDDLEVKIKGDIKTAINDAKGDLVKRIRGEITKLGLYDKLKTSITNNINKLASEGKEKVDEYLGKMSGKTKSGTVKTNLKNSLLGMGYRGYLRVLLLVMDKETKMNRIEDVIQLNLNKQMGVKDFKLVNCNTYLRAEAEVSMKYFFPSFIPDEYIIEGNRRKLIAKVYKGY